MAAWKKGLTWIGVGIVLVVAFLALAILGGGEGEHEPHGARLALFVIAFYGGFSAGAIAMVRGVLYFMEHIGRQQAAQIVVATVAAIVLAVVLHNVVYAITGVEEAFFFLLALLVGPVILVAAIVRLVRPYRPTYYG